MKTILVTMQITADVDSAADITSVPPEQGQVDFPPLLREAVKQGITHFYIEDESKNAVNKVPQSVKYLKSLE